MNISLSTPLDDALVLLELEWTPWNWTLLVWNVWQVGLPYNERRENDLTI